jgi:hypothetical protein
MIFKKIKRFRLNRGQNVGVVRPVWDSVLKFQIARNEACQHKGKKLMLQSQNTLSQCLSCLVFTDFEASLKNYWPIIQGSGNNMHGRTMM